MNDVLINSAVVKDFTSFLEEGHYRKTPERFAILNKVLSFSRAFTIDMLASAFEADSFHLSPATLYNTVELLIKANIVRRLYIDGMPMHYERVGTSQYTHLVCTVCGKVKNVKDNNLAAFMTARKFNAFTTSHYVLTVYGTCNACARRLKKAAYKKNQVKTKKINSKQK